MMLLRNFIFTWILLLNIQYFSEAKKRKKLRPKGSPKHSSVKIVTQWPISYGINIEMAPELNPAGHMRPGHPTDKYSCDRVREVPNDLKIDKSHYKKYTEAYNIPIVGSASVTDKGLKRACYIVRVMFASRHDIRLAFYKNYGKIGLIGDKEVTTSLPEHKNVGKYFDDITRGLGATFKAPISTAGDENQRCCCGDSYPKEDILMHEVAHGIHILAASHVIHGFHARLHDAYKQAMKAGKWKGSYAAKNMEEYWALGVTFYFNSYNQGDYIFKGFKVDGKDNLKRYDLPLYRLIEEVFPCNNWIVPRCKWRSCTDKSFVRVSNPRLRQRSQCKLKSIMQGLSLNECMDQTCFYQARGFAIQDNSCLLFDCPSDDMMLVTVSKTYPQQIIYKRTKVLIMDLREENAQQMKMNCLKPPPSAQCKHKLTKVLDYGSGRPPSESDCQRHGGCYSERMCYYAKQDCLDRDAGCAIASISGECERNYPYMLLNCPVSCNTCNTKKNIKYLSSLCQDKEVHCLPWAQSGECQKNPLFMNLNCRLSCKLCTI